MFKTIFAKQFTAFIGTIVICLIVLGMGLSGMFKGYLIDQKKTILEEQGCKIANFLIRMYSEEFGKFTFSPFAKPRISAELQTIREYIEVSLIVTDEDFSIVGKTYDVENLDFGDRIDIPAIYKVMDGEITNFQGRVKEIFDEELLVVAIPIIKYGEVKGAVLMVASMLDLQKNMEGVASITFLSTLIAGVVSFILVYITSKTISKPIHQINDAAKVIANGDFEKRLSVKSRDEVGQLAENFNYMAESLENQEKHRRDFIANISHDLRSPLTSMRGFLQAIIDGTIPLENQERYLNIILEETDRLSKLANDIMDISKLQNIAVELNKTKFDINELIRKTVIMFEARIINRQIDMNVIFANEKTNVYADYEKIQRVVYNLVDNAVKFTDTNGIISVETFIREHKVYVKIKDNGKGISQEDQKRVFERFYKADISRGEDKKGSGLGLSIVKEFIKAHDSSITLTSKIDEGCEFEFGLELA